MVETTNITESEKISIKNIIKPALSIILGGVIMLFLQAFFSDNQQIRDDLIALDKDKASTTYVDKKDRELKEDRQIRDSNFSKKLDDLNDKTDHILELMIKQK
jgi:hypothetical protein